MNEITRYHDPTLQAREALRRRAYEAAALRREAEQKPRRAEESEPEYSFETVVSIRVEVLDNRASSAPEEAKVEAVGDKTRQRAEPLDAFGETVRTTISARMFAKPEAPPPSAADPFSAAQAERGFAAYAQQRAGMDGYAQAHARRLVDVRA